MKIGILTQPLQHNYGGLLQAWAFQNLLLKKGYDVIIIARQYDVPPLSFKQWILQILSFLKTLKIKILNPSLTVNLRNPFKRSYRQEIYADKSFVKKIKRSPILISDEHLRKFIAKNKFDAFIVGSDQVWREEFSPRIETYFLDFIPETDSSLKIAFSSSLGTEQGFISKEKLPNCKALLQRFDAVSIREDGGLRIIQKEFGRKDAIKTLDPTLLLDVEEYLKLIKPNDRTFNKSYIASYILDTHEDKEGILSQIKSGLGLSVTQISIEEGFNMPTVSQWLVNIADSKFVVTDSFHGCVFSIIFHKPFIAIGNEWRGLDRFTSLLSMFGLMDRLVLTEEEFRDKKDSLLQPIDYTKVDKILEGEREKSLYFLTSALAKYTSKDPT